MRGRPVGNGKNMSHCFARVTGVLKCAKVNTWLALKELVWGILLLGMVLKKG